LLDSFYGAFGYVPWYNRPEFNTADGNWFSEFYLLQVGKARAKEERDHWTDEQRKAYVKYDAVISKIGQLGDITKADAYFLVGRKSGCDELHVLHHIMEVPIVAIHIERLVKSIASKK
jgi:hypothetical protein